MTTRKDISVEQRLYEAFRKGAGVRLSSEDIDNLIGTDDALKTRLTNAAAHEAGHTETVGYDCIGAIPDLPWKKFGEAVRDGKR